MDNILSDFWNQVDSRYEGKLQIEQSAVIERVDRDANRQVRGIVARVQGASNVPINGVSPNSTTLAAGQVIAVENVGSATAPAWMLRASGLSGSIGLPRVYEFNEGVGSYVGGDLLLGSDTAGNANFFYDESEGKFVGRIGTTETLGLLPASSAIFVGQQAGKHVWIDANGVKIKDATTVLMDLDGTNGIRMYSGANQRVWIKADGSGWLGGSDKLSWNASGDVTLAGTITAGAGSIGGWSIDSSRIYKTNAVLSSSGYVSFGNAPPTAYGNNVGAWLGYSSGAKLSLYADASNYLQWDGAKLLVKAANFTLDASGNIDANNGTLAGLTVDGTITVGTGGLIQSAGFSSGVNGWRINTAGDAEFNNLVARGAIKTVVFQKQQVNVIGGSFAVMDGDTLASDMTASDTAHVIVKGNTTFATNDILRIKEDTSDEWLRVTGVSGNDYTVTRDLASIYGAEANPTWKAGATVVKYGQSGAGGIMLTSSMTNAPYISIFTHAGSPWSAQTEQVRIGNLKGKSGYAADAFGIYVGDGTNYYLKYDPTDGLQIKGSITVTGGDAATQSYADQAEADAKAASLDKATYLVSGKTTINGGKIETDTITAGQISVTSLDAFCANMGNLTVNGLLSLNTTGELRAGTTTNGIRLGYISDGYYLRGVGAGVTQFEVKAADGKLYAGGGYVVLDSTGIALDAARTVALTQGAIKWKNPVGGANRAYIDYYLSGGVGLFEAYCDNDITVKADSDLFLKAEAITVSAPDAGATTLTVNGAVKATSYYAGTLAGKILIASGVGTMSSTGLTNAYADLISVTQTVPAGTLVIQAYLDLQCTALTAANDVYANLVVDGSNVAASSGRIAAQWQWEHLTVVWVANLAAGSRTWKLQGKKSDTNNTINAREFSRIAWQYYV